VPARLSLYLAFLADDVPVLLSSTSPRVRRAR